jgi:hypothetical protein
MTATHVEIMKSDRRGRLCYTQEQRDALVKACKASGLSTPRFAAIHGVKYQTLAAWIHRRNLEAKPARPCLPQPTSLILESAVGHRMMSAIGSCGGLRGSLDRVK